MSQEAFKITYYNSISFTWSHNLKLRNSAAKVPLKEMALKKKKKKKDGLTYSVMKMNIL